VQKGTSYLKIAAIWQGGREGGRERELSRNVKSVFSLVAEAVRPHTNYLKS
jgi:hypothetical protein